MKKSQQTKKTLTGSIISLIVCIAMLIGTTFAWFTDTASTSVNTIQSGKLKITLEKATAWDANGEATSWEDVNGKTIEFKKAVKGENVLWEPGCTYELPELRITNVGNLALKYKVQITGIQGDQKLNEVIDWTVNGADIGTEYHLKSEEAKTVTIKGHMQETAGNDYQGLQIDGVKITVNAVQDAVESDSYGNTYDATADGTPQFDTWLDNVSASETITLNTDTVIKDREADPTITATIPAGSTTAKEATLVKTTTETPANITIETGTKAVSAEIKLVDENGNKISAQNSKFFVLTIQAEKNANVIGFYHNGAAVTKAASAEAVAAANDLYYYDAETGIITFSTDDFSAFTVVTSDSKYNGGNGTENAPYLIATEEQALAMRDGKGYFKLVEDIVVSNEIYLSGKTYTLDLNGHSLTLAYGENVKPNNGGTINISGKNGRLIIKDSSENQTGAVYGSDKTYSNKVTSAVRVGNYGKLDIYGGHFYGRSQGTSCIFVCTSRSSGSKATVNIYGGMFETASPLNGTYYVLNHQDSATTGCTINVSGGKFKNYNPGVTVVDPVNAYTGKITLSAGCKTTEEQSGNDTWYVVSK